MTDSSEEPMEPVEEGSLFVSRMASKGGNQRLKQKKVDIQYVVTANEHISYMKYLHDVFESNNKERMFKLESIRENRCLTFRKEHMIAIRPSMGWALVGSFDGSVNFPSLCIRMSTNAISEITMVASIKERCI